MPTGGELQRPAQRGLKARTCPVKMVYVVQGQGQLSSGHQVEAFGLKERGNSD